MRSDVVMKKMFLAIFTLLIIVLNTGCGKKSEIISADLAKIMNDNFTFSEKLTEIDSTSAEERYSLSKKDYNEICAFVGTKGTCDEFVIIKTDDTESVIKKLNKYLEVKYEVYSAYRPNEIDKLKNPIIEEYKNTVVMIISNNNEDALRLYKEYLKK